MAVLTIEVDYEYRKLSMMLDLDRALDQAVFGAAEHGLLYEADVGHVMLRALRGGDVAVDVGANMGFFTVLMATAVAPNGRVVAFEPGADNLERLQRNIAASGMANIEVIRRPVSDRAGPTQFYLNSDSSGGHALWNPGVFPGNNRSQNQQRVVELAATTLDHALSRVGLPAPRLIKIDTEGAEHRVLAGATELLRQHVVPYIIAELHEFGLHQLGSSQRDLRRFMQDFGYTTFALAYDGSLPKLIPPETALQATQIINLLFSTVEDVGRLWPSEDFHPLITRKAGRQP